MSSLILIFIGVLAGIISGMGIGGGAILIPALTIFLNIDQKLAQTINLIYFVPTASMALITHIKNKNIQSKGLLPIIIFGVIGAIIGSCIAINIDSSILKKVFGWFLLIIGLREIFKKDIKN